MRTVSTSEQPRNAPAGFRDLPPRVVTSDGDGLWLTWHGSGEPDANPCEACGNTEGNLRIYENWGHSYPNGNSWSDYELLCARCGLFSLVLEFTEG